MKANQTSFLKKATGILQIANAAVLALWVGLLFVPGADVLRVAMGVLLLLAFLGEVLFYWALKRKSPLRKNFYNMLFLPIMGGAVLLLTGYETVLWSIAFVWVVFSAFFRLKTAGALFSRRARRGWVPLLLGLRMLLGTLFMFLSRWGILLFLNIIIISEETGRGGYFFLVMAPLYALENLIIYFSCRKAVAPWEPAALAVGQTGTDLKKE